MSFVVLPLCGTKVCNYPVDDLHPQSWRLASHSDSDHHVDARADDLHPLYFRMAVNGAEQPEATPRKLFPNEYSFSDLTPLDWRNKVNHLHLREHAQGA